MKIIMISAFLSASLLLAPAVQGEIYKSDAVAMGGGDYVSGIANYND